MAHLAPAANEPELRLFFLAMLETALGDARSNRAFMPYMAGLLLEAVMPNAVWRAGRVASTVRKVTIACLYTLLKQGLADQQCLFKTAAQILPVLKGLDDSNDTVRRSVCLTFAAFFGAAPPQHFSGTVIDYTLDCLFVHLDDSDRNIQDAVFDVIKE